jgi:hypothetical protein
MERLRMLSKNSLVLQGRGQDVGNQLQALLYKIRQFGLIRVAQRASSKSYTGRRRKPQLRLRPSDLYPRAGIARRAGTCN